jgi:hypothetical protein
MLANCREARNLMAHYPCWIEPVNDEQKDRTVALKLLIGDRHHVWDLNADQAKDWVNLFLEVRRELIRLRHELVGADPPVFEDNSLSIITGKPRS